MTATTSPPPTVDRAVRDTRGYWRVLLAVLAPVGFLVVATVNFLTPYTLGDPVGDTIPDIEAHQDLMAALIPGYFVFLLTFVPAGLALIMALRRVKPVFTAVMGTWMVVAAMACAANPPLDFVILTGLREDVDQATLTTIAEGLQDSLLAGIALLPMILLLTFGRIALGVLFWKANVAPRWLAVLMIVSPFIEFAPLGLGNAQPGLSWAATGVAMSYVSIVLFRMRNDEFDLPATGKA